MNSVVPDQAAPATGALAWLCAGMGLCILPHARHLPAWVILAPLVLMAWRLGGDLRRWPLPGPRHPGLRRLLFLFVAAACAGVLAHYHTLIGREPGTSLLVLLAGFKILETGAARDFYISVFLGFFVLATNFFYTQSIFTAVLLMVITATLITALITHHDPRHALPLRGRLRYSALLLAQAAPLMLVLFLLFPRVSGPLWGLPRDAYAGLTGISDSMEPGSISQLSLSDEVAMRVEFFGAVPDLGRLYWRGPVLWHNDGRKWTRGRTTSAVPGPVRVSGDAIRYAITQEPTNQNWLFALEMPEQAPASGFFSTDFQLLAREPVRQRIRYELISRLDYQLDIAAEDDLWRALQLPAGQHPQAVKLGAAWQASGDEAAAIVQRALQMFNEEEFYYTLAPPLLAGDNVDEFLFGTRRGFCEHYAGALVVLMRAAGVPARVVTGYQGGEYNPLGNYMLVRQSAAHAWTEVWLGARGWVRVDPTAAIAPERVMADATGTPQAGAASLFERGLASRTLLENLALFWDAAGHQWNQWVISYGPQRQALLLERAGLGGMDFGRLALLLTATIGVLLAAILAWLTHGLARPVDPARTLYDRFCGKLSRAGLSRHHYEGPLDFARRAGSKHRKLRDEINDITRLYILVRYGSRSEHLPALRARVRKFNPI